ncbi:hypothetical protein ACIBL8_48700 [Streptomyces sp. NPDC050523]|uniref:hypothetical protein n=1 Tax=Streptomyces sp. NPDC050523 TaxID=3365622 RepID=UPI0037A60E18
MVTAATASVMLNCARVFAAWPTAVITTWSTAVTSASAAPIVSGRARSTAGADPGGDRFGARLVPAGDDDVVATVGEVLGDDAAQTAAAADDEGAGHAVTVLPCSLALLVVPQRRHQEVAQLRQRDGRGGVVPGGVRQE